MKRCEKANRKEMEVEIEKEKGKEKDQVGKGKGKKGQSKRVGRSEKLRTQVKIRPALMTAMKSLFWRAMMRRQLHPARSAKVRSQQIILVLEAHRRRIIF